MRNLRDFYGVPSREWARVMKVGVLGAVVGSASGAGLERLVVEALNVILDPTAYQVVDRPDTGAEDFWFVGPDGDFAPGRGQGLVRPAISHQSGR